MKFSKKRNQYEASNVTFDAEKLEAFSYGWWKFVTIDNGLIVFNNYNYSPSTSKHQSKVRKLMNDLGIKIDMVVYTRLSLDQDGWKGDAAKNLLEKKGEIIKQLSNSRRKKSLDEQRKNEIENIQNNLKEFSKLSNCMQVIHALI